MAEKLAIMCVHGINHGDADAKLAPSWTKAISDNIRRWKPDAELTFEFLAYDPVSSRSEARDRHRHSLVAPATSRDAQGAQNAELAGTQTGAPLKNAREARHLPFENMLPNYPIGSHWLLALICVRDRPKLTP
jgi:hypothetical protein